MKAFLTVFLILLLPGGITARQKPPAQQDGALSLDEWLQENIDDDVLRAFKQMDQDRLRRVFLEMQQALQGTNIYQLGALKQTASEWAPILAKYEETYPLAAWLQTHLDYLDAANEMQREMKSTSVKSGPGAVLPAPPLKLQRSVWIRELDKRPWPPLAKNYVPQLKQVFTDEGVPPELVWVAEVESSFDPRARSPAGAAGMFQLMPETARAQKLSLWPWDERYQPEKSARATARYLRYLHDHFGDWPLALAAYNAGESRVDRLLKQHKAHGFDAIARWLPAETQMYVPKIEATVRKREGVALAELRARKA